MRVIGVFLVILCCGPISSFASSAQALLDACKKSVPWTFPSRPDPDTTLVYISRLGEGHPGAHRHETLLFMTAINDLVPFELRNNHEFVELLETHKEHFRLTAYSFAKDRLTLEFNMLKHRLHLADLGEYMSLRIHSNSHVRVAMDWGRKVGDANALWFALRAEYPHFRGFVTWEETHISRSGNLSDFVFSVDKLPLLFKTLKSRGYSFFDLAEYEKWFWKVGVHNLDYEVGAAPPTGLGWQ